MTDLDSSGLDRHRIGFGDTVRVRRTSETEAAGLAGLEGDVFGQSIPSASGVAPVIGAGEPGYDDYAVVCSSPTGGNGSGRALAAELKR